MFAGKYIDIAASGNTVVPHNKLQFLWDSVKACPQGDIIEIGTWKGGTSLVISAAAREYKPQSKVYLCDTFTGIALAGPNDNYHKNGDFGDTTKQHVNDLLQNQGLTNFTLLEGIFPYDTGHLINSDKISMLHIDVDTYAGYLAILRWAQNRLVDNAIVVFDDYAAWSCLGAKKAVDEYFAGRTDFEMHLTLDNHSSWARYKKI
jgi:O-methyltransferase